MRQQAVDFLEEWVAVELLCVRASGESEAEVRARFVAEASAAGLTPAEMDECLADADMPKIFQKHSSAA